MATVEKEFTPEEAQPLTTNFPQYLKNSGTNFPVPGLAYDATTKETAYWHFLANSYGSGNLTAQLFWYADTATSGDIIWGVQVAAITPDIDTADMETKALATAQTVTDTHLGTTGQRLHQCVVTVTNLDAVALGDYVALAVYRDAAAGGDTMAGDGILVAILLSYSTI